MASVDASNSCIPPSSPLVLSVPPLPSTIRGEPSVLDGRCGRINENSRSLLYASGRLVICRNLTEDTAFCYRGHTSPVTAASFSPSGCYVASADARGKLRVWSYDNEEHLAKLDLTALSGPIRGLAWDVDSKRIALVGERADASSDCARVIQWDTGVTCGDLGQHARGRASCVSFKPGRPMRIVTGGTDDSKILINSGPPFKRLASSDAHVKGAVYCVAYNHAGTLVASVGSDKSVCLHDGKTLELVFKKEHVHDASIYACSWSSNDEFLLTCSADGTVMLLKVPSLEVVHTWNVAARLESTGDKVPIGGMQLGCTFVKDDVPTSVCMNGEIMILPRPSVLGGSGDEKEQVLTGHCVPIAGLAVKGDLFYTADTNGVVVQWNTASGKAIQRLSPPNDEQGLYKVHGDATISCLTVTSNGTLLTAGWDDVIRISRNASVSPNPIPLGAQPNAMVCGTDLVVVMTVGGLVLLKNETPVSPLIPLEYAALSVCISKDDSTIYVGGEDCNIHIYSVSSSFELSESGVIENGHLQPIHALALSHDQTKLASSDVRDVCVWNLAEGNSPIVTKGRWCFHTQRITCLAWSKDDSVLVSGGADDSIFLWSLLKKTKRVHYPFCHRGGVTGLEFIGDWRMLSVGVDACVNQWDVIDDVAKKFG